MGAVEEYVVSLLAEILGEEPERGKSYPWARGDTSQKTGHARQLPFDAVWESRRLIVEVDESQHRQSEPFFDHLERVTVSGVHRGEQRRIYDQRKREAARRAAYLVLEIPWEGSRSLRRRDRATDLQRYRQILREAGVTDGPA